MQEAVMEPENTDQLKVKQSEFKCRTGQSLEKHLWIQP